MEITVFKNKKKKSAKINKFSMPNSDIFPVAICIDDEVQDIINCQPRLQALLLSSPEFFDLTLSNERVHIGWMYNRETNSFEPKKEDNEED